MEIRALRQHIYNDVHLPAIFVTDYMGELSADALRAYLGLVYLAQKGEAQLSAAALRQHIGLSSDELQAALIELQHNDLVDFVPGQPTVTLVDIKDQAVLRLFRPREGQPQDRLLDHFERDEGYRMLSQDINNRFFGGRMGVKWLDVLETFYSEYRFEPQVIYVLFNMCRDMDKLRVPYVLAVGANWHESGVVSYADMSAHLAANDAQSQLLRLIGRRLSFKPSQYHRRYVERWTGEYGFDKEIIELALERVVKIGSPNFNYFDSILRQWHEAGLQTTAAIEAFEGERERQHRRRRSAQRTAAAAGQQTGDFEQRRYDDDYLMDFYADPSRLEALARGGEGEAAAAATGTEAADAAADGPDGGSREEA